MSTQKPHRARVWDPEKRKHIALGYYATAREKRLAEAKALADLSEARQEVQRGHERFETFAERTLLARKRRVTYSTWMNYQRILAKWIMPTFGTMKLRDITPAHVDTWFSSLPVAPSNAQRYAVLSLIMKRAVAQREIDFTPCLTEGVSATKCKPRPEWSWTDFQVLYEATVDDQERALLWTLAGAGCRIGEALALNREDVNLDQGDLTISKHLTREGMVPGTKAHTDQVRYPALPQRAVEALRAHLGSSTGLPSDPVFTSGTGSRMTYTVAFQRFDSLRRSRGLEDLRLHDLRHLALTAYGRTGASMAEIMSRGGHSDYRSALRYQHVSRDRDRALIAQLDAML
ncbi:tyrosine-type recombinase/integrase [Microbacterium sp. P02]|uniref:tyrosine-type recombinase/integrase n=1 Tax=Microbacterium sp. P02 TaxID=3366260 RepID=UPI00366CDBCA